MNIIAAVDKHWAIGNRGKLLVTIPDDQKLFREETKGKVIVMGRKTLESLPAGQPLAGRKNAHLFVPGEAFQDGQQFGLAFDVEERRRLVQ